MSALSEISTSAKYSPYFRLVFADQRNGAFRKSKVIVNVNLSYDCTTYESTTTASVTILRLILGFAPCHESGRFSGIYDISITYFVCYGLGAFQ